MGLIYWLEKRLAGDTEAELKIEKSEEDLSGLNLKDVLDAHLAWRGRLDGIINGTNWERPEVSQVAQDNLCVLGKWLQGTKSLYGHLPEFETLRKTHAEFHLCAGEVLMEFNQGNIDTCKEILRTRFRRVSDHVQLDLVRFYSVVRG